MAERARTKQREQTELRPEERITATIEDFQRLTGLSRSRVYELLRDDEIESVHIRGRHLVIVRSYYDYLTRLKQLAKYGT